MVVFGVTSDTHGLLRPSVIDAFAGVQGIIHAGDIGDPAILTALERVAPVTAVLGNCDRGDRWGTLPDRALVEIGGQRVAVVHDLNDWDDEDAADVAAVISGHTHRPSIERRDGVLYLNPGSAGPRRFNLPVTVALLRVQKGELDPEIVAIPA